MRAMRGKMIQCIMVVIAVCFVMAGCGMSDKDYIDFVKNGCPKLYPDISYAEAFGAYFEDGEWEYFKSEDDEDVVEFTGTILYYGENTKLRMQFLLDYEDETFEAHALKLDGVQQSDDLLVSVILEIFNDYEAEHGDGEKLGENSADDFTLSQPGTGGEVDSAGRKIFHVGDTVQMTWSDGGSVEIAFLDWGIDYDLMDNSRIVYLEYEVTNTGTGEVSVSNYWFTFYADNYLVEQSYLAKSDMGIVGQSLSPKRNIRGRVYGEIDPDSASIIEVEFSDAVLILKDDSAGSGMWSYENGVPSEYSELAGYYSGWFYDMSVSIYSSPERLIIGSIAVYDGETVVDRGDLFREDENMYGVVFYGSLADETWYLWPQYSEGVLCIEVTDENGDYEEIFTMQEHYES